MLTKAARDEIRWELDTTEDGPGRSDVRALLDDLDAQDAEVARLTAENDRLIVIAKADEWQARYWAEHNAVADREATIMAEREKAAAMRRALEEILCASVKLLADHVEQLAAYRKALEEIVGAKSNWQQNVGSYAGGETWYGFACRLQKLAEAAIQSGAGKALLDAHAAELEKLENLLTERSRQALARILELEAHAAELAEARKYADCWAKAESALNDMGMERDALRQRAEAAELFRATLERPHGLRSGQCCDPVIDGEICALLRRMEAAEATVEAVKVEISGDANFGRIVELLFYGPLREKEEELRLAHGKIAEMEGELAERALGVEGK